MVKLRALLGARSEVHYECMYTKNKTQKRKIWHDGFVLLTATHKLVLYDDLPPAGKTLDEAKMNQFDWERRDEEYISVPKFLIEIINETPIEINGNGRANAAASNANSYSNVSARSDLYATESKAAAAAPPRPGASKFRTPVAAGSSTSSNGPNRLNTRPGSSGRQPLTRLGGPPPLYHKEPVSVQSQSQAPVSAAKLQSFDFERNPTAAWPYKPHAISRSVDEVAALLDL